MPWGSLLRWARRVKSHAERRRKASPLGPIAVLFLGAFLSGCCTPQPDRLDPKKCGAYLDAVASVVSFQELYAPEELRADAVTRGEEVNAAGRKLLAR